MKQTSSVMPLILQQALRSARTREVPSGQIILYEGDTPQEVYILKSGIIKIYDIDDQGNEKILHLVKSPAVIPFAFFSELHDPLRWFYASLTDCEIYILTAKEFLAKVHKNGELSQLLTNNFSDDVHELLVRLTSLSKTNAQDKVVAVLWFLATHHANERRSGWWRVDFAVNHQLIADMCGITRESTSLVMKDLLDKKIIRAPKLATLEINTLRLNGLN